MGMVPALTRSMILNMASERQANFEVSPWWGEHVHRYQVVEKELTQNDSVLDIACGTGYGAARLSSRAGRGVIGGDLSRQAVERCRDNWKHKSNLEFRVLDGTKLDFP